ncbi:ICE-LIKE PROTEASE (CASPASE) P20 DOMAIN PROTEIN [Salix purpurea]|uniref:ICE-LIKE PROTEASE (CASPASE) P20 DOMAIN PROTEIN n=1 Tax=Salix purpurea TaxID=77065 RepID=A0A9Q0UQS4_SALPP|nr:ICE-LIKE PROTEASE (CASPASE) P20 DOMAIN PROTEIN [Salix purpurea]
MASSPSEIWRSSPGTRTATKRALLIGVTYKKKYMLKGTVNDVMSMRELLIKNFGFKEQNNIRVLTEQDTTRKKILESMEWLVRDCQAEGMISDNEINSLIVWPLKKDVTLHAIVDACHSGTVLDLEHVYNREQKRWEDNSPPSGKARKHTDGGLAISISACQDHEIAVDTSAFTKTMNGALTYLFSGCLPAKVLRKIFKNQLLQTPQISSSKPFDVYKKHFLL